MSCAAPGPALALDATGLSTCLSSCVYLCLYYPHSFPLSHLYCVRDVPARLPGCDIVLAEFRIIVPVPSLGSLRLHGDRAVLHVTSTPPKSLPIGQLPHLRHIRFLFVGEADEVERLLPGAALEEAPDPAYGAARLHPNHRHLITSPVHTCLCPACVPGAYQMGDGSGVVNQHAIFIAGSSTNLRRYQQISTRYQQDIIAGSSTNLTRYQQISTRYQQDIIAGSSTNLTRYQQISTRYQQDIIAGSSTNLTRYQQISTRYHSRVQYKLNKISTDINKISTRYHSRVQYKLNKISTDINKISTRYHSRVQYKLNKISTDINKIS